MLGNKSVLIVEDNAFLALDLAQAIEDLDGQVAGPTNRVAHALELLDNQEIVAAVVDCHLPDQDVLMLTGRLAVLDVPFILHVEADLPDAMSTLHPNAPVLRKPVQPKSVIDCLLAELGLSQESHQDDLKPELGNSPKLV